MTTNAVKAAVDEALEKAMGKEHELNLQLTDGNFVGNSYGHGGPVSVEITTKNNRIVNAKVIEENESPDVADLAIKRIPAEIVKQQTLAVDAIKHNLKVALVEKNDQVGGLFRYSAGGYALANTKKIHD